MKNPDAPCGRRQCGDPWSVHQHYTKPGDLRCGLCPCPRWRRAWWPRRKTRTGG